MTVAHVNRIATATPPHDIHAAFVDYACNHLSVDERRSMLFRKLANVGAIDHRYSFLQPSADIYGPVLDSEGVFVRKRFPPTSTRLAMFARYAPELAEQAVRALDLGEGLSRVTHLVVTCCTGFSAPGVDLQLVDRCGLNPEIERTSIGFMGCYAAVNGLKFAHHVVRSDPAAQVLLVNLELCTLHFKETDDLEQILSFFLFADGCAASLISAEPEGVAIDSFRAIIEPNTEDLITWKIGDGGFDMELSGRVPKAIRNILCAHSGAILEGVSVDQVDLWAVHPGGRTVLDAVQQALELPDHRLAASRDVLREYGNMSSATVMFVLKRLMEASQPGQLGCGMAFGPGLVAETFRFHRVG